MKFTSTLFFVQQYGLLGFMVEAPVNPNFLLDKEVILKEDNFISKKCVMKAQDYSFQKILKQNIVAQNVETKRMFIKVEKKIKKHKI